MVGLQEYYPKLTPEEYFAWEEQQEVKHEYFDGEVFAMTRGTLKHSRIGGNFHSLLDTHLENSGCQLFTSDARIKIESMNKFVYPDVSVTCDERDLDAEQFVTYPCLIIEVLSPSTETYNRKKKFKLYQRSTSLIDYVLVSTEEIEIEVFHKNDRRKWEVTNYIAGDVVELESIKLTFPIERIYRGIKF